MYNTSSMANQKEIRVKISSTKKTMKITSAMKLVAAAKVNKMQKRLLTARPYAAKISELVTSLRNALEPEDLQTNPLLVSKPQVQNILLVVISSDRGLCGGYNANIIKATNKRIRELKAESKNIKLLTVGRKAKNAFSKAVYTEQGIDIQKSFINLSSIPTNQEAALIADYAKQMFLNGEVDKVEIIFTSFISLVNNIVKTETFLPCDISMADSSETNTTKEEPYVLFEPSSQSLVDTLVPLYIQSLVYQALIEATTSELAARMTAMSNATNNAKEFIKRLVLKYNKARQASITQEISEIVGGAAALTA